MESITIEGDRQLFVVEETYKNEMKEDKKIHILDTKLFILDLNILYPIETDKELNKM